MLTDFFWVRNTFSGIYFLFILNLHTLHQLYHWFFPSFNLIYNFHCVYVSFQFKICIRILTHFQFIRLSWNFPYFCKSNNNAILLSFEVHSIYTYFIRLHKKKSIHYCLKHNIFIFSNLSKFINITCCFCPLRWLVFPKKNLELDEICLVDYLQ